MNKFFLVVILLLSFSKGYSQKIDYPLNNRVTINFRDHIVYAYFTREEGNIHIDDNKYYYWFAANDIKKTRGGYDGKILHGLYTAFYMNKNLKEKGKFRYGLKKGEWKEWYSNGELKEKSFYKGGEKAKAFTTYYSNGRVKQKGTYKKGLLNGKLKSYDSLGVLTRTEWYKKGTAVPQKIKETKVKKKRSLFGKNKNKESKDSLNKQAPASVKPAKKKFSLNPFKKKEKNPAGQAPVNKEQETEKKKMKKEKKEKDSIRVRKLKKVVPADSGNSTI